MRSHTLLFLLVMAYAGAVSAQTPNSGTPTGDQFCRVEPAKYKGWDAEQVSNRWVQLVIVPQNGGRLMQVTFNGHAYLFNNPKLAGKYFPPTSGKWFNYGGDKIWLLPEGNDDEQHWVGNSDLIDDGPYAFRKLSDGKQCEIELTGPADPQTGVQFQRTIQIDADSPGIQFHVTMKNVTGHMLEWSMQSVSQYDTSDRSAPEQTRVNRDFWTFTPANPSSAYLNRYHVRFGPAENPSVEVRDDGLFALHYPHMAAELWLDSQAGWLAVVDGSSRYAMVERFQYEADKTYPGKASVIFWTNGQEMHLNPDGVPTLGADPDASPIYLEAELNSPMCRLRPGESCSFDTQWFPTRAGNDFRGVMDPGVVMRPLQATPDGEKVKLSGSFGVFFEGHLVAHFYDQHGASIGVMRVADVSPADPVILEAQVTLPAKPARVSLHLEDESGLDRGALQEVRIGTGDNR
ncbi:MAG TPA: hypothetical protein VMB66_05775 [Candidatus Acidoferrales bacterium]|nr:hypothetical protein [Candidatus Acidoferrales bacterium]